MFKNSTRYELTGNEKTLLEEYLKSKTAFYKKGENISHEELNNFLTILKESYESASELAWFKFDARYKYLNLIKTHLGNDGIIGEHNLSVKDLIEAYQALKISPLYKKQTNVIKEGVDNILTELLDIENKKDRVIERLNEYIKENRYLNDKNILLQIDTILSKNNHENIFSNINESVI